MIPFLHVYLQICFDCANRKLRLKEIHCSREKKSLHHETFELSFSACLFFYLFIFGDCLLCICLLSTSYKSVHKEIYHVYRYTHGLAGC